MSDEWLSRDEAARALGVPLGVLDALVSDGYLTAAPDGRVPRTDVDALAVEMAGWVTAREAADILQVTDRRVRQLTEAGYIPCVDLGVRPRYYRRAQIEVVANARLARYRDGVSIE